MSWEVLTMRSATSFFNGAIARSDLRRYWPVLFLYVGLWLIFLPIPVWNRAAERNPALVNLTELCADTYATAVVLALIFGGMMAMASFSYLMNPRSVGAMHALPQRRGTLFWTHFSPAGAMLAAGEPAGAGSDGPGGPAGRPGSDAGPADVVRGGHPAGPDLPGPGDPVRHGHRVAAGGAGAVRRRQLPGGGADLAGPATGGASAGRLHHAGRPARHYPVADAGVSADLRPGPERSQLFAVSHRQAAR